MKNYKAHMTAQNMEITEYNKEALARLMIFGTMIGQDLSAREVGNTISIINDWNINGLESIQSAQDFQTLKDKNWTETQNLSDFIALLVDILSESDFFDIQNAMKKILEQYSLDFMANVPNSSAKEASKIKFSNNDFACQFYESDGNQGTREVSKSEKLANLMYLSNQLSHAFMEAFDENKEGITNVQIKHVIYELKKIKDWSIHELIAQKMQGDLVDISISQDPKEMSFHNSFISVSLPNYLEPFRVHFDSSMLTEKEMNTCDGTERYLSRGIKTTFPQYISDEKMELLEKVYRYGYPDARSSNSIRAKKLQWLFDTKRILKLIEKRKVKNSVEPKKDTKFSKAKKDAKFMNMQHENMLLVSTMEKGIGKHLPDYFKDGFLKRTSYSLTQYMETIYAPVKGRLMENGIENVDAEICRLMLYMKMTKPLSIMAQRPKEERIDLALQSLDEYQPVLEYIIGHVDSETSYSELKSKTRKYANSLALEKQSRTDNEEEIFEESPEEKEPKVTIQKEVTMPVETVQSLIDEITELNAEMGQLSTTIQEASTKLSLLDNKIAEVQRKLNNALNQDSEDIER